MAAVAVIAVNYRSGSRLRASLESIMDRAGGVSLEIVIVDNSATDGPAAPFLSDLTAVSVIESPRNVGFGAAVNAGLEATDAPWVLVVNPDTTLVEGDVAQFVAAVEARPDLGVAGPRLLRADGSVQLSQSRFPSLWRELAEALYLHRLRWSQRIPVLRDVARTIRDEDRYRVEGRPEWVNGPVLLFRRQALREVGGFDPGFFLYWEEVDWCWRAKAAGWAAGYLPVVTFVHEGGGVRNDPELFAIYIASWLRFLDQHFSQRRALAHKALLAFNLIVRLLARMAVSRPRRRHPDVDVFRAGLRQLARSAQPGAAGRTTAA